MSEVPLWRGGGSTSALKASSLRTCMARSVAMYQGDTQFTRIESCHDNRLRSLREKERERGTLESTRRPSPFARIESFHPRKSPGPGLARAAVGRARDPGDVPMGSQHVCISEINFSMDGNDV